MSVGDAQRQTAVGEALIDLVHPIAVDRRGANVDGVAVEDVGGEFHGAFHGNAANLVERNVERNDQGKCPVWFKTRPSGDVRVLPNADIDRWLRNVRFVLEAHANRRAALGDALSLTHCIAA